MVLLGGLYLLLSRVTGQDDLVIGAPSVGRSGLDAERMIGLFLDTLALRMRLSGSRHFASCSVVCARWCSTRSNTGMRRSTNWSAR